MPTIAEAPAGNLGRFVLGLREAVLTLEPRPGVPLLWNAHAAALFGYASDDTARPLAVEHVDPRRKAWAADLEQRYPTPPDAPSGVPQVLRSGKSEFYPLITDAMLVASARDAEHLDLLRQLRFTSAIVAPLLARG